LSANQLHPTPAKLGWATDTELLEIRIYRVLCMVDVLVCHDPLAHGDPPRRTNHKDNYRQRFQNPSQAAEEKDRGFWWTSLKSGRIFIYVAGKSAGKSKDCIQFRADGRRYISRTVDFAGNKER
jgi:hypothetical protein